MTATALIRVIKPMQQMNAMDGLGVGAMKDRTPAASIMRRNTVRTGINTAHTSEHFEIVFVSANMIANMTSSSNNALSALEAVINREHMSENNAKSGYIHHKSAVEVDIRMLNVYCKDKRDNQRNNALEEIPDKGYRSGNLANAAQNICKSGVTAAKVSDILVLDYAGHNNGCVNAAEQICCNCRN